MTTRSAPRSRASSARPWSRRLQGGRRSKIRPGPAEACADHTQGSWACFPRRQCGTKALGSLSLAPQLPPPPAAAAPRGCSCSRPPFLSAAHGTLVLPRLPASLLAGHGAPAPGPAGPESTARDQPTPGHVPGLLRPRSQHVPGVTSTLSPLTPKGLRQTWLPGLQSGQGTGSAGFCCLAEPGGEGAAGLPEVEARGAGTRLYQQQPLLLECRAVGHQEVTAQRRGRQALPSVHLPGPAGPAPCQLRVQPAPTYWTTGSMAAMRSATMRDSL